MQGIQLMQQGRPPYIRFEQRAEEDRNETIRQKKLVLKDVNYVVIHPPGSKDTVEKIASEWLDHCEQQASQSPPLWPMEWVHAHRQKYEDFKNGLEVKPDGFSIRQWPAISKAQAENIVMAGILTVEDMAAANEQTLNRVGMGARAIKDRAKAWLESSKGNVGEELAALRVQIAEMNTQLNIEREKRMELEAARINRKPA